MCLTSPRRRRYATKSDFVSCDTLQSSHAQSPKNHYTEIREERKISFSFTYSHNFPKNLFETLKPRHFDLVSEKVFMDMIWFQKKTKSCYLNFDLLSKAIEFAPIIIQLFTENILVSFVRSGSLSLSVSLYVCVNVILGLISYREKG